MSDWYTNHDNLIALASWLQVEKLEDIDTADFLEKPYKWQKEWEEFLKTPGGQDFDESPKVQMTITVEPKHREYIQKLSFKLFEGNISMAIRKIVVDHIQANQMAGNPCLVCDCLYNVAKDCKCDCHD